MKIENFSSTSRFIVVLAAFVIVVAGMRAAESIIVPFLLSIFIAIISTPPLFWLQRNGVPRWLAMLIVAGLILGFGFIIAVLVGRSINNFTQELPNYQTRMQEEFGVIVDWLNGHGVALNEQALRQAFNPEAIVDVASNVLTGLGAMIANGFLIMITVVFILLEASSFPEKVDAALKHSRERYDDLVRMTHSINHYMALKTIISAMTGLAIWLMLVVIGVDYPILWGLLAFLLNFVPNIGSFIAAVPAVMLAFVQLGLWPASVTAVGFVVVNTVVGNVVEPRMMGRGLGLSTLVVFLSLVFWGWVLGPVGMLLSVPLTMTLKIAMAATPETRWLAILLGSEKPEDDKILREISAKDDDGSPA